MTYWLIPANSKLYNHGASFEHFSFIDWRQGTKKYQVGDVIFIYTTKPSSIIEYECYVEKVDILYPDNRDDKEYWINETEYSKALSGKFMRLRLISQIHNPLLSLRYLLKNGLNGAPQGATKINPQLLNYIRVNFSETFLSEIYPEMLKEEEVIYEGLQRSVVVNKYERSSIARQRCIEYHGTNCVVCNMNFFELYGDLGKDFIHVHHLTPVHKVREQYKIDYRHDLVPVCPNCHSMLHRRIDGVEPTIDELKKMLKGKFVKF